MAKNSGFFDKTGTNKSGIPYIRDAVPYLAKLFLQVNFIGRLYEIGSVPFCFAAVPHTRRPRQ